ncbi:hypothetical protein TB9_09480 [Xanthomonas perforans]|nr:hypothetical protein XP816_14040 [Xanthomonas perforans]KLC55840.1 hypothetical protein XP2010_00435 [Xanthomonas perforans]KLC67847.1 hypothetical protein GEV839_02715 [Xanthomonas perforans]KLD17817.1 hypothetical protein GEV1054_13390 [Xanthomonas perforans]KLD20487.1 hypothetical protein GEV1044_02500 [Xanthomonas perforans]
MVVALITQLAWRVHRNQHGHLEALNKQLTQRQGKHSSLVWIELMRKRHLDFSANARVLASLGRFVRVPKMLRIEAPRGRALWRKHLMKIDTASVGIIVTKPRACIEQIKPCSVSRCCD